MSLRPMSLPGVADLGGSSSGRETNDAGTATAWRLELALFSLGITGTGRVAADGDAVCHCIVIATASAESNSFEYWAPEGCKYSDPSSRRALIFMQQPAETISTFHRHWFRAGPGFNWRSTVRRP